MEFKFRSIHHRSSTYYTPPPPPNLPPPDFSYVTHHAVRAGTMNHDLGLPEFHRNPPNFNLGPNPNPTNFREAMQFQRELEKERIRAEIIAEEIVRRRILEEEVRRELMLEREMALKYGYAEPMSMRFDTRLSPLLTNFDHREKSGVREMGGFRGFETRRREIGFRGGFETLPFQRDPVVASASGAGNWNETPSIPNANLLETKDVAGTSSKPNVNLTEIKGDSGSEVGKDKVVILAKPIISAADLKRKAATQPDGPTAEMISSGSKKQKTTGDWSCALCRVSATSERGLNEHLLGKKHKAREKGLLTQRTGFGTTPSPKKTVTSKKKQVKTPGLESSLISENKDGKTEGGAGNNVAQKKKNSVEKKGNGEAAMSEGAPGAAKPKKQYKFWCQACKVGVDSLKVMNAHKKGKRHLACPSRSIQNGETKTTSASETLTENVSKQETVGEQAEVKDTNFDNNQITTSDKEKKASETVCNDAAAGDENNQVAGGTAADSWIPINRK